MYTHTLKVMKDLAILNFLSPPHTHVHTPICVVVVVVSGLVPKISAGSLTWRSEA